MDFDVIKLKIEAGILAHIADLIKQKPELFEEIDLRDYATNARLEDLDEYRLTENGKAGWITIDDEQKKDRMITYRFYWQDVCGELT